jgi:hypothetical protein
MGNSGLLPRMMIMGKIRIAINLLIALLDSQLTLNEQGISNKSKLTFSISIFHSLNNGNTKPQTNNATNLYPF